MNLIKLIKAKHDKIIEIAHKNGAVSVKLFGSVARGQTHKNSDIDLLLEMKHPYNLLDLVTIKQDLEDLLQVSVHVVTMTSISPYLQDEILKEAVNL